MLNSCFKWRTGIGWVKSLLGLAFLFACLAARAGTPNWPSFRGVHASGVADGQNLPDTWNGETGENIRWRTLIPGLAHSSPVIWEDRIFVTTAVSDLGEATFKHGLYGSGDASPDRSVHQWKIYGLNKTTGEILWERTAHEGVPKDKRHIKATYANSTPVTDGRFVVALFGSEGLFTYDLNGNFVWKKELGRLNLGAYDLPEYEWGSASSPIIYRDLVIVQCDTQGEDFLIACNINTGETVWRVARDELPSWSTPTIYPGSQRPELITNAPNLIRGYDPNNGTELWRLGGSSKITAPTPIFFEDLIVVASGRRPERPIFVIKSGAHGDISLKDGQTSNEFVLWSRRGKGPYMPTPIIYKGYLYVLANHGVFDCYELRTGEQIYRKRISHSGGGFSASPVAADDKLYLASEDGGIFVIKAGPQFAVLAENQMGELLMATPALSEGAMFVRAKSHLFAIGR